MASTMSRELKLQSARFSPACPNQVLKFFEAEEVEIRALALSLRARVTTLLPGADCHPRTCWDMLQEYVKPKSPSNRCRAETSLEPGYV
jgi:hypothetical protein